MNFLSPQPLGRHRTVPRLWIESQRLNRLGFTPGTPLAIRSDAGALTLRPAILGENHVSSRRVPGGRRPIIDLASQSLLSGLADFSEVKIIASFERIQVSPSHRAFALQRRRTLAPPLRVLEVFAGGGTLTAALTGNGTFQVVAGVEIEPDFADEWQAQHPEALLVPSDLRALRQAELERIHGCTLRTPHYATAVQMLGQGVLTRVFRAVFDQLASQLTGQPHPAVGD